MPCYMLAGCAGTSRSYTVLFCRGREGDCEDFQKYASDLRRCCSAVFEVGAKVKALLLAGWCWRCLWCWGRLTGWRSRGDRFKGLNQRAVHLHNTLLFRP